MKRPVMDPTFVKGQPSGKKPNKVVGFLLSGTKWFVRWLFSRPFSMPAKASEVPQPRKPFRGLMASLLSWLLFLPSAVALSVGALVYLGTHPSPPPAVTDPHTRGLFFTVEDLTSADGTPLKAWLVPVIDARRVLDQRDDLLRHVQPAVVLVHDYGQSPQQMLPLLKSLHEEGLVLMVVGLRGVGTETLMKGQTFGFTESQDVQAAVDFLRTRQFIDPHRIGVIAVGTGANAALIAADRDATLRAMVLVEPVHQTSDLVARKLGPKQFWGRWLQPLCRWGFSMAYKVNPDEASYERYKRLVNLRSAKVFEADEKAPRGLNDPFVFKDDQPEQIRTFLRKALRTRDDTLAGTTKD